MPKQLFLEEAVLDDLSQEFDYLELPLSARAFRLLGAMAFIIGLAVIAQIFSLGWLNRGFYSQRAVLNASQITTIRAERGIILDRFGKPLLTNAPSFRVNINLSELLKDDSERKEAFTNLEKILSLPEGYIDNLLTDINLEKQNSLVISREVTVEQVLQIKSLNLEAVQIESDFKRQYLGGAAFSHIIGYVGPVDKNDLSQDPSLSFNDTIGKNGIESYYDDELRGEDGQIISYRNAKGVVIGQKTLKSATPGDDIFLTIDSDLQSYFYDRLKQGLDFVGSKAGVGIALDPRDGEILAIVNIPSFDNNKIKSQDLIDQMKPLFNRAISGVYSPGSTIKPVVAFGALKEGVITPDKEIFSPGYLDVPNPYNPGQPSRFLDWRYQGNVNLYSALAKSSNVYFYEVGGGYADQPGLGIVRLKEYWQKFGLGKKTGIDLPAESDGFLPDPETKEASGRGIWRIGDTYNVSIGQGDLLVTPIQLINYIAAIANAGKLYEPSLFKKMVTSDGKLAKEDSPQILADYSADSDIFQKVEQGMIDGVVKPYGTSHTLSDLPIPVAAKTGTAQIEQNTKTNAIFAGYAPRENPEIAVLVLIENAKEGSLNAVPVAKDVFEWYYKNRIVRH